MEISGQNNARELAAFLLGVHESERTGTPKTTPSGLQTDQIRISQRAKEIQQIKSLVQQTALSREEHIERLRQAIEAGTYDVSGRRTADALIRNVLTETVL